MIVQQASRMSEIAAAFGPVRGFDYLNEQNVDFVALQPCLKEASMYRRIGRGRVVATGWIDTCKQKSYRVL